MSQETVFHVLFKEHAVDLFSKGVNYRSTGVVKAFNKFTEEHPKAVFIGIYDLGALVDLQTEVEKPKFAEGLPLG